MLYLQPKRCVCSEAHGGGTMRLSTQRSTNRPFGKRWGWRISQSVSSYIICLFARAKMCNMIGWLFPNSNASSAFVFDLILYSHDAFLDHLRDKCIIRCGTILVGFVKLVYLFVVFEWRFNLHTHITIFHCSLMMITQHVRTDFSGESAGHAECDLTEWFLDADDELGKRAFWWYGSLL